MAEDFSACDVCGWHCKNVWQFSSFACAPERGRVAKSLAKSLPEVPSTQEGYGAGALAFEIDDECHLKFEVEEDCMFWLRDLYLTDHSITADAARELVAFVADWRRRHAR